MRRICLLMIALLVSACENKTTKDSNYAYMRQPFPWGMIAIWTIGTPTLDNETTTRVGAPYKLMIQFKMHERVPDCLVALDSLQLNHTDGSTEMTLPTPSQEQFELEKMRAQDDRETDPREWYSAFFTFDNLQLAYQDYDLRFNFSFNSNCGLVSGKTISLPLRKDYSEKSKLIFKF